MREKLLVVSFQVASGFIKLPLALASGYESWKKEGFSRIISSAKAEEEGIPLPTS
jgi:hypothetical protein